MFLKTLQYGSIVFGLIFLFVGLVILTVMFAKWLFPGDLFDPWGVLVLITIWIVLPISIGIGHLYADHTKHEWNKPKTKPTTESTDDRGV